MSIATIYFFSGDARAIFWGLAHSRLNILRVWHYTIAYEERSRSLSRSALSCSLPSHSRRITNSALKTAKSQSKPLLLYFFSKNCYYCNVMDSTTMADKRVANTLKKDFVFLRVDVDESTDIAGRYRISGTPSSWFLEPSGKRVGEIAGYIHAGDYRKTSLNT